MKAMGIVDVSRFPFPTLPDATGLRSAISLLENLGATRAGRTGNGEITPVGKALALLPIGARYAKMLLLALQGGLLAHATAVVAMLTEGDPFLRPYSAVEGDAEEGGAMVEDDREEIRRKQAQWMHPNSDALARWVKKLTLFWGLVSSFERDSVIKNKIGFHKGLTRDSRVAQPCYLLVNKVLKLACPFFFVFNI